MRQSFRQTMIAAAAVIGFGAFAAVAAPTAGDSGVPAVPEPAKTHAGAAHDKMASTDQRIADLHTRLQITPAQQPQWDQFAQVMQDNARAMEASFKARIKAMPTMTAPENMQSYAQVAMGHAQDVQKLVPVFQALYDTMSDTQKRAADQIFRNDAHSHRHG